MNNITIILLIALLGFIIWKVLKINSEHVKGDPEKTPRYTSLVLVTLWFCLVIGIFSFSIGETLLWESSKLESTETLEIDMITSEFPNTDSYIYPVYDGLLLPLTEGSDIVYTESESGLVNKIEGESKDVKILITETENSTVTVNTIKVHDGLAGFLYNKKSKTEYLFTIGVDNSESVKSLNSEVEELEKELIETKEENLIYRDKLNQIEMRNEGIEAQESNKE